MDYIALWNKFSAVPGGKKVFSLLLGKIIPYTGSMGATVQELARGRACVTLRDRRGVRNHLKSIHAVALMNLGELTSGLAAVAGLPPSMRGILVGYRIEYLKKARGTITATSCFDAKPSGESKQYEVSVEMKNQRGELVSRAFATWLIGPST